MESSPRCPIEVQEYILDYLHDDARTLEICALVCADWLPTSRYHLFDKVTVRSEHRTKSLSKILVSPHCTILESIGHLILLYPSASRNYLESCLWPTLSSVRTVEIHNAVVTDGAVTGILSRLPMVQKLTFSGVVFDTSVNFSDILEQFSSLGLLTLVRTCSRGTIKLFQDCLSLASIHSLSIGRDETLEILAWLSLHGRCDLRALQLVEARAEDLNIIDSHLNFFPQLSKLQVNFASPLDWGTDTQPVLFQPLQGLRTCEHLHTLTLKDSYANGVSTLLPLLPFLLTHAPSTLAHLELALAIWSFGPAADVALTVLDAIFAPRELVLCLATLKVDMTVHNAVPEAEVRAMEALVCAGVLGAEQGKIEVVIGETVQRTCVLPVSVYWFAS